MKVGGRALGQVARRDLVHVGQRGRRRARRRPARSACRDRAPAPETGCRFRPAAGRAARARAVSRSGPAFGNVTIPASETKSPRASPASARASLPVKQCSTPRTSPPALLAQDRDRVLVGFAGVDDDRPLQLAREPDLRAKHRVLDVARREVVVVVEADLADRARRRRRGELLADERSRPASGSPANWCAWCGCTPIENRTSGQSAATRSACAASFSLPGFENHQRALDPGLPRAGDRPASRSVANVSSARWQWLSITGTRD